jgi:peptide/nickel transport system permease protein
MMASALLIRRLALGVPTVAGISVMVFSILLVLPGNPAELIQGDMANPAVTQALVGKWGLDQPVPVRFARWGLSVLQLDFGQSLVTGRPVAEMLWPRLAYSAVLGALGLVIGVAFGVPAGIVSATRKGSGLDSVVTLSALFGLTVPPFVLALLLQLVFAFYWRLLPISGAASSLWDLRNLSYVLLPAITVGVYQAAVNMRVVRVSTLEIIQKDYIRTGRGKGLSEPTLLRRHALPNVLIPFVTLLGVYVRSIVSGLLLVEIVFAWPGVGRLFYDSVLSRDYPVIQSVALVIAVGIYLTNLLVDMLYGYLDPRVRVEGGLQ